MKEKEVNERAGSEEDGDGGDTDNEETNHWDFLAGAAAPGTKTNGVDNNSAHPVTPKITASKAKQAMIVFIRGLAETFRPKCKAE